jgi:hypothetical protein
MPAYAKISLVSSVFHPSDIAFARGWSEAAPGFGGWNLVMDSEDAPERVSVVPPGADDPVFVITRGPRDVRLQRLRPGAEPEEIGSLPGLREALLMLCALTEDALLDIHERLEEGFPRRERRNRG